MTKKRVALILAAILVVAALMRLWALREGDPMSDEVLYAFRAIGMLDFDEANEQTTPLEWYDPLVHANNRVPEAYAIGTGIPWWTSFSFHDHPLLVFFIQHIFMRFFGESTFVFRLPSALLGIASVYLLFLIGRQLFSQEVGLFAAAILAVNTHHLFISRLGLQEVYVVFFLFFASYLFLRSLDNDTFFIWTGAALGFGFLAKYTAFILIPIFFAYLFFFKRDAFSNKKFWLGALLALLLFSPVIVYNIKLYQAVGHFDFQFSHVFGQNPDAWQIAPGKEIGTLGDRFKEFIPALFDANSPLFLIAAIGGIIIFTHEFWKLRKINFTTNPAMAEKSRHFYLLLAILFLMIFIVVLIGPSPRFLAMLTPFLALAVAYGFDWFLRRRWRLGIIFLIFFLVFEIAYAVNSFLFPYPKGPERWAFSPLRYESFRWGYNELDVYLQKELAGKMPALHFDMQYQFLNDLHKQAIKKEKQQKLQPSSALILYDGNIDSIPQLWALDRLNLYHAWPVIKIETFDGILREKGEDYFQRIGFKHYYVIIPTENVPWKDDKYLTQFGSELEKELVAQGRQPISIQNQRGEVAFRIYKFNK